MSAMGVLCTTAVASLAVILVRMLPVPPPEPPAPVTSVVERPWLTRAAAAQLIAPDGTPGPLFADVTLGGPAPGAAMRAWIAAFARAHHVALELEIDDDELVAIAFAVTYPGCCGYEGADVLALRLGRPKQSSCCGCEWSWIDAWTRTSEDGRVATRARVRVNRVEVRWTPAPRSGRLPRPERRIAAARPPDPARGLDPDHGDQRPADER